MAFHRADNLGSSLSAASAVARASARQAMLELRGYQVIQCMVEALSEATAEGSGHIIALVHCCIFRAGFQTLGKASKKVV